MKKIFVCLLLCMGMEVCGMEKNKQPASQLVQRMYKKEYEEWLNRWQLSHTVTTLAWYLSMSIYQDLDEIVQRTRESKETLKKQIDQERVPFNTAELSFKYRVKDSLVRVENQVKPLNLKIKHLEALAPELKEENARKSKL